GCALRAGEGSSNRAATADWRTGRITTSRDRTSNIRDAADTGRPWALVIVHAVGPIGVAFPNLGAIRVEIAMGGVIRAKSARAVLDCVTRRAVVAARAARKTLEIDGAELTVPCARSSAFAQI